MFTKEQLAKWRSEGFVFDDLYDQVAVEEKEEAIQNDYLISVYWSSDAEGKKKVAKANLGETVYYQIRTRNIKEGTLIKLQLFDKDIFFDDNDFPTVSKDNSDNYSITDKNIVKAVRITNSKATIRLVLEESWKSMISDDFTNNFLTVKIELFWKATFGSFKETLPAVLNVYHSLRTLYFNPPLAGYNLPELLTSTGETIVMAIGDALEVKDKVSEKLDDCRFFIGARILEKGKLVNNFGEIEQRKKSIYSYDVYTNDGKLVTLKKASNFGYKNIYVKNGRPVTTKGISQLDYFSNKGVVNNIAKIGKELLDIWDVTDLTDIMFKDGYGTLPIPTPWGLASGLLTEFVIKPEFEIIMQNLRDALHRDFEIIKQRGLEKCILFSQSSGVSSIGRYRNIRVNTRTLKKLLKGDFLTLDEMIAFNGSESVHTIFYRFFEDENRKNTINIIDCIFINDNLLENQMI